MRLLRLLLSVVVAVKGAYVCPNDLFDPFYDGTCAFVVFFNHIWDYTFENASQRCAEINGNLPSFHSKEENERLFQVTLLKYVGWKDWYNSSNGSFWIGLQCEGDYNYSWMDGTKYDYHTFVSEQSEHCDNSMYGYLIRGKDEDNKWDWYPKWMTTHLIVCTTPTVLAKKCGDYDETASGSSRCMKLYTNEQQKRTWTDAEARCRDDGAHLWSIHSDADNNWVRRTAMANGLRDGINIGLKSVENGSLNFAWTDGSPMNYTHYGNGYPAAGAGDCTAMQIGSNNGQWMNTDCSRKLPFICSRYVVPTQPSGCPSKTKYLPGDHIYSPSYPNKVDQGNCEYHLSSGSWNSRVGFRVETFDINVCCHLLDVYSDTASDTHTFRFTGSNPCTTLEGSDSDMRLVWNSTEASQVRGWHITVIKFDD